MFIWFTLMILIIVSLIAIALEGASYMNLHSNLQQIADAAALSGAKELDGAKGAISRATDKAKNYLNTNVSWSNIALSGSQIASVKFYSTLANLNAGTETSNDNDAAFIQVTTVSRSIATSFKVVTGGSGTVSAAATASAASRYAVCAPVQSYMCNPYESLNTARTGDGSSFLGSSAAKVGDMFQLVAGAGAPGDWGLIQPPGTKGNPNKNQPPWWAQSGAGSCTGYAPGTYQLDTSPGNTAKFAVDGENVRFDRPISGIDSTTAPVVISGFSVSGNVSNYSCGRTTSATPKNGSNTFSQTNACGSTSECTAEQKAQYTAYDTYCTNGYGSCPLPRDRVFSQLGSGNTWGSALKGGGVNIDDLKAYWANHHAGTLPSGITTRYQLYQQEVANLGGGTASFTPASEAREPAAPQCQMGAAGGLERRIINVAIVDCDYWGIKGRSQLPIFTATARFFMTEPAQSDGSIFAELVDVLQVNVSGSPVHQMVQLVK